VRFVVVVRVDKDEAPRSIGTTPARNPLAIPECEEWWVYPEGPIEEAVAEIKAKAIPGLALPPGATDADLAHLQGLTGLQTLNLVDTKVTDAGLEHLKGLTGLQTLLLGQTQVTDAGLAHLKGLKGLRELNLSETRVTEAGMSQLKKALPNVRIVTSR
jgi:Leucine-rich repeat (LRR) protein